MLDLIIVFAYLIIMLLLGWRSRRQSAESYWVAERKYSSARITMSLVATIFGASSTMGVIGLGYTRGLTAAWWSLTGGLALIPFGLFLASRVRELNVYTLPDILKKAYGERVAAPAGVLIGLAWLGVIAAQLIAGGKLVSGFSSIDFQTALLLVAIIFTAYTFLGGQLSVIRTDTWQLLLFLSGLIISLGFVALSLLTTSDFPGNIPHSHWDFPASDSFGLYEVLVFYPIIVGLPYLVGPDIYSRILCARDNRVARKSSINAALIVIPVSFLLAFLGLLARSRFPEIPPETALPAILDSLIPIGLKGLIVAGFLGAIMSSADTCLISASTIIAINVFRPLTSISSEKTLGVTRVAVLILGAIAWFIASRQQGIISSLLLAYTIFVGGVVAPTFAALFPKRLKITSKAAMWAIIVGGGSAIMGKVYGGALLKIVLTQYGRSFLELTLGVRYLDILPIILSVVTLFGISRVTRS